MRQREYRQLTLERRERVGDHYLDLRFDGRGRTGVASPPGSLTVSGVRNECGHEPGMAPRISKDAPPPDQFGAEGWELVGMWERTLFFKRPKG
jgi:hypothetical protein